MRRYPPSGTRSISSPSSGVSSHGSWPAVWNKPACGGGDEAGKGGDGKEGSGEVGGGEGLEGGGEGEGGKVRGGRFSGRIVEAGDRRRGEASE